MKRRSEYLDRLKEFGAGRAFFDGGEFRQGGTWREKLGVSAEAPLVVDVGCNDGVLLAAIAGEHKVLGFVGVDWSPRLLFHAGRRLWGELREGEAKRNVALVHGRAEEMEKVFEKGEVDEVWLFQPEPMQLTTRLATRLFDDGFLGVCASVLKSGGRVTLKTDHAGYYQWACGVVGVAPHPDFELQLKGERKAKRKEFVSADEVLKKQVKAMGAFEVTVNSADYWNDAAAMEATRGRAYFGVETTYERMFKGKGLPIYLVELRKK